MKIHKILLILALLLFLVKMSTAQMKTTRQQNQELYANGSLKKVIYTKITRETKIDLYNYYIRTVTEITEFHPNGKVKAREKIVDKIGEAGGPCYHLFESRKEYDENGILISFYKSRCDKRKSVLKKYNERGKLLNTTVTKRQRWE